MSENAQQHEGLQGICVEARLTPEQCNTIIEERLTHLVPVMECALVSCRRVSHMLANGGFNWRKVFKRAKERHLQEDD